MARSVDKPNQIPFLQSRSVKDGQFRISSSGLRLFILRFATNDFMEQNPIHANIRLDPPRIQKISRLTQSSWQMGVYSPSSISFQGEKSAFISFVETSDDKRMAVPPISASYASAMKSPTLWRRRRVRPC
jgi:hypothetical protein